MDCTQCGSELTPGKHFCTNCGAPVPAEQQTPSATPLPPVVAPVGVTQPGPVVPPQAPAGKGGLADKATGWKVLAVVLAVLVAAGLVVGIIFIVKALTPNKPVARISLVTVNRQDGKKLDLKKVPLGVDLTVTALFEAKYPKGGRGTIKLYVESSSGEELIGKTFKVKSAGGTQKQQYIVNMTAGSGKPVKAKAKLDVTSGSGAVVSDERSAAFTAEKGTVDEQNTDTELDTARKNVESDFSDLLATAKIANSAGIDISDVRNEIADLGVQITEATTVEDLDAIDTRIAELQADLQARIANQ
jgi:hypothetical protein